ncbi:class I adenylate-forming enzyme family protein [Blastococcus sp. SYSU D00820]
MQRSQPSIDPEVARAYRDAGWWSDGTVADAVAGHAAARPEELAYVGDDQRLTWRDLHEGACELAGALAAAGVGPGDRVAVWMPDTPLLHLSFLAVEHAGGVVIGLGARAGARELVHLLGQTGAAVLVTEPAQAQAAAPVLAGLADAGRTVRHVVVDPGAGRPVSATVDGAPLPLAPLGDDERARRRIGPDDLFLINSTSGTTGLPKAVLHTQNRWYYFHTQAVANGRLTADDVFLGAVPAPFGFGIWTAHVSPLLLGARTLLTRRFRPETAFELIERERVTVLCAVSTQFIMMLASPELRRHDLSSLRVMFTGGEAVPYERARDFERLTGAAILQFYGSNETGLLSGTTLEDPPERRLRTAGRIVPDMRVRLYDGDREVPIPGRGRPACKGPATSIGYLDDAAANEELFTPDGWMLMGDICEIDDEGYLTVVGRTSDFIIRGGKNISAPQVEADVATHPAVAHAAAVAMPDPVFGERVCVYVELVEGATLDLPGLLEHLAARGISKELYPERLVVVDQLPRSSGAKVAKGELRADIRRRIAEEQDERAGSRTTPDTVGAPS